MERWTVYACLVVLEYMGLSTPRGCLDSDFWKDYLDPSLSSFAPDSFQGQYWSAFLGKTLLNVLTKFWDSV